MPASDRAVDAVLWSLSALLATALITFSLGPGLGIGGPGPMDLLLHFTAYAANTFVLLLAAVWRPGRGAGRFPRMAMAIALGFVLFGVGLEILQGFRLFSLRRPEPADAIANAVGVAAAMAGWFLLRRRALHLRGPGDR